MCDNDEYMLKMSLLINGNGKSYFLKNNLDLYYGKIENALLDISNDLPSDYLYFSFIALCSATLEYSLNLVYSDFFLAEFVSDYASYVKAFSRMEFKLKLKMLPYILSHGEFVFNENSPIFQSLNTLIKRRNDLLHPNGGIQDVVLNDIFPNAYLDGKNIIIETDNPVVEFTIKCDDSEIEKINKFDCAKFGDAIKKFRDLVVTPFLVNRLITESELIRRR